MVICQSDASASGEMHSAAIPKRVDKTTQSKHELLLLGSSLRQSLNERRPDLKEVAFDVSTLPRGRLGKCVLQLERQVRANVVSDLAQASDHGQQGDAP